MLRSQFVCVGIAHNGAGPSYPYAHTAGLFDVTSGSNCTAGTSGGLLGLGASTGRTDCAKNYLDTAGPGYDGPTGVGALNGLSAF